MFNGGSSLKTTWKKNIILHANRKIIFDSSPPFLYNIFQKAPQSTREKQKWGSGALRIWIFCVFQQLQKRKIIKKMKCLVKFYLIKLQKTKWKAFKTSIYKWKDHDLNSCFLLENLSVREVEMGDREIQWNEETFALESITQLYEVLSSLKIKKSL